MAGAAAPSYVVGIGASAGGLEALESFFDNLPKNTGMAFVVVQHLSPDFKSLMDELLARHTTLPIHLVENGMTVDADSVYLIPPKKEMIISDGRLLLSERHRQQELTLPIDLFFRSLAQDCGSRSAGIILSGGGSDGSRGLRDIYEAGGLVIVQDTESAQFDGMPRAALDTGLAHYILAPALMPRALIEHTSESSTAARRSARQPSAGVHGIEAVYTMLQDEFGIDFTHYKPSTVTRRIERRLMLAQSQDIEEYLRRLRRDRAELDLLYRDLLIGVTRFFRDEEAFQKLENEVLPELFASAEGRDSPLRIWIAGCATGEEAYSMAIVVSDLMLRLGERPVQIFATDVHPGSLEHAGRGIFGQESLTNVSDERLGRYFLQAGSMYQVIPELRQMIVFAAHDVIKDAPFTRVDLITCRNLLIYLQPFAQQRVLSLFHFALNRGGVLFLGPSESPGPLAQSFEGIDKHWRIYRKQSDVRIPVDPRARPSTAPGVRGSIPRTSVQSTRYSLSQLLATYDVLLDEIMPPSFLVNERGELIHSFGGASRFLRPRDGRQAHELLDMVDSDLRMVLIGGLKRAMNEDGSVAFKGVRLSVDGHDESHRITIRKLESRTSGPSLLISFERTASPAVSLTVPETEIDLDRISREQLAALESELSHTKESLQAAVEELEASNEELQASNEELQASNEELQSTNEELQSVNEELYTVNSEYQRKIAELTELTNDMDNLLSSTEVGTIFMDHDLRIRKFTPQIAETFSLVPHDVGRPIDAFANRLDHPELVEDLRNVLTRGEPVERELRDIRGKTFFLRVFPYRVKGSIDGVVLTVIDVSGLKAAEDALFHERYLLNSLLDSMPDAIYFKDARGKFIRLNQAMAVRLGLADPREAVGKTSAELARPDQAAALEQEDEVVLRTGEQQHYKLEQRTLPDGSREWDLVTRLPLRDRDQNVVGIIAIIRSVTDQKRAEERIQEAVRLRDQFLAMLSHELRNPLGAIVTTTGLLKASDGRDTDSAMLMNILDRQSQQMARLLDDLLETSRVTQNKIALRKRIVDINAVSRDAADAVRGLMNTRGLSFTMEVESDALWVDGDPARLQQIQVNLLSNAAKFTPAGGSVSLKTKRENGFAVIRVRDDGVGISRDMLDSVFELFVQSTRTLDRSSGGLGVGLTLVRALVALHGGTVEAHSDGQGQGCEFVVRLPIARAVLTAEPAPQRVRRVAAGSARVVVVEDNEDSRTILCELLKRAGFECESAGTGASGLALVESVSPDIVLLDVGLPEMDGFEVARRIRANPKHASMVLIALTGYGRENDRIAALEAGFDEHLVKPIQAEHLVRSLMELRDGTGDALAGDAMAESSERMPLNLPADSANSFGEATA